MSEAFELSRRRLLQVGGGAFAASLAAACAPTAPTASPTRFAQGTPGSATSVFPTYVPAANGPRPDVPAPGPGYDDGFNKFPTNPAKAMTGDPPGTGSTVKIMSIALFPPPTPLAQNPAWQAVNKALNADVQFDVVSQADYPVKVGTVMASNDMPDMLYLYAPAGSSSTLAAANGLPQFLQAQAADLTPYLGGDAQRTTRISRQFRLQRGRMPAARTRATSI